MPWYMDRHDNVTSSTPQEMADRHMKDLAVQDKYGVKYVTGWYDEKLARVFCLVDAPSKRAAAAVHQEAHGATANEIIEVDLPVVEEFMGRVEDTPLAKDPRATERIPALRVIIFTDIESSTRTMRQLGDEKAMDVLHKHNSLVRTALNDHEGREVKHTGDGIMASFVSASRAIHAAIDIQRAFATHEEEHPDAPIRVRIGLTAGEPVLEHDDLFGTAVNLARRCCDQAESTQIVVPDALRQLVAGKGFLFSDIGEVELKGFEEPVRLYEVRWREA